MKILHIMNYYQENMGYQENWLPYYQKELDYEVLILTSDKYFPFPNYEDNVGKILGDRIKGEGVFFDKDVKIIREKSFLEISSKAIVLFKVKSIIENFNPDAIHLHGITNLNLFSVLWCIKDKKIKLFIDSHSDYQVSNYKSIFNKLYYKIWSNIYKIFDKKINLYLPTTKEGQKFIVNEFKINIDKTEVNYLGVNSDNFYYDENAKELLVKKYNLENKIVIINAGKQYEGKKIDFIIQVVKELVTKFKREDIALILIGNASKEYERIIQYESQNILEHITRISFLENKLLKDYYSLADIGIWPGIPSNTIQEAMACEVSIILPTNDTTSHLIDNNGFFIKEFDAELVAKNINDLIKNSLLEKYKHMSRKIVSKYSWKEIAKQSLEIYENY